MNWKRTASSLMPLQFTVPRSFVAGLQPEASKDIFVASPALINAALLNQLPLTRAGGLLAKILERTC